MAQGRVKFTPENEPETQDKVSWGKGIRLADLGTLGGFTLYRCHKEERQPGDYNILFSQKAYREVDQHLKEDTSREHGGLLLGYATGTSGPAIPTVIVTHALRGQYTDGTPTSLTFHERTWEEWDRITDEVKRLGIDLQRVGWYHSHPNIQIFLSRYDLDVCTTFNRLKCPVALVVDPVNDRGGFFTRGPKGYDAQNPKEFWEIHAESEAGVVWHNLHRVEFDSPAEEATAAPPADEGSNQAPEEEPQATPTASKSKDAPTSNSRRLRDALLGVAVLALAATAGLLGMVVSKVSQQQVQIADVTSQLSAVLDQLKLLQTGSALVPGTAPSTAGPSGATGANTDDTSKTGDKKSERKTADKKKPETKKPDAKKPEEKKTEDKKDEDNKGEDKKGEDKKSEEKKGAEAKQLNQDEEPPAV